MNAVNPNQGGIPSVPHIYGCDNKEVAVESLLPLPLADAYKNLQEFDHIYTEMVKDLKANGQFLTERQCRVALETILATAIIERDIPKISKISNENLRNDKIIQSTFLKAETGFSRGKDENEVENTLNGWVGMLMNNYQKSKTQNHLEKFFKSPSNGDPCLNGRYISVMKYGASEEGISEEAIDDITPELDAKAYQYTELMMDFRSNMKKKTLMDYLKNLPDFESHCQNLQVFIDNGLKNNKKLLVPLDEADLIYQFIENLPDANNENKKFLNNFKVQFKEVKSPGKAEFIEFLKQLPNYESEHKALVESNQFASIYYKAVEFDQIS